MSLSIPILLFLLAGTPISPTGGVEPGSLPGEDVVIMGRVLDRVSGRTLAGAELAFLGPDPDSTVAWRGLSGPEGAFRSTPLPGGSYLARVSRAGYRALDWDVQFQGSGELELEISLVPDAIELAPVVVELPRRNTLERTGFLQRRRAGVGYSLDRSQIEEARPLEPSDLLRGAPGVSLAPGPPGHGLIALMRNGCIAQIFLDGTPLGATVSIDDLLGVADVEGIEILGAASQPAQFSRGGCGSILVWTRDGRDPGPGDPWNRTRTGIVALLFTLTALLGRLSH